MPSFNSAQYNLQKPDRARTGLQATANVSSGEVHYAFIPYTVATTEAAADTINLCQLPTGAIPIPQLSSIWIPTDNVTHTTASIDVGCTLNPDGWFDGVSLLAAGNIMACSGTAPEYAATPTSLAADAGAEDGLVTIYATIAAASGGAFTAGSWYFCLAYKMPV